MKKTRWIEVDVFSGELRAWLKKAGVAEKVWVEGRDKGQFELWVRTTLNKAVGRQEKKRG